MLICYIHFPASLQTLCVARNFGISDIWLFSIYRGIELQEVYAMSPKTLEPFFKNWTDKVIEKDKAGMDNPHINNPKIPIKFVRENGKKVYPVDAENPVDPAEFLKTI